MRAALICLTVLINFSFIQCQYRLNGDPAPVHASREKETVGIKTGTIASDLLVECSGIDVSMTREDLLWAINDSGDGPYIYALGIDGGDRGRIRISGAANRDWEDLATFNRQGRSMILVADVGDNLQRYGTYRFYIVEEPHLSGERFDTASVVNVAWAIEFTYPDQNHDAEAVAVDPTGDQILILTKRDNPRLLFSLPLKPTHTDNPLVASRIAAMDQIPPPTADDLLHPYGRFRSQPTALDLSPDGLKMMVLTYKHAYLFERAAADAWEAISSAPAIEIPLPLPQDISDLGQREAACFSWDADRLYVTSEGHHAAIYRFNADSRP
jgi:hypothetical protein